MFGGWKILYSGAIRFNDDYNFGVYVIQNPEDITEIELVIINENTGEGIYPGIS